MRQALLRAFDSYTFRLAMPDDTPAMRTALRVRPTALIADDERVGNDELLVSSDADAAVDAAQPRELSARLRVVTHVCEKMFRLKRAQRQVAKQTMAEHVAALVQPLPTMTTTSGSK